MSSDVQISNIYYVPKKALEDELRTNCEKFLGIKGALYQTKELNEVTVFTAPINSSKPMCFWPRDSYSSPLKYNQESIVIELEVYKERTGELLYFTIFKNLLSQGLKLLKINGFQDLYLILTSIENWEIRSISRTNVS